MRIVQVQNLYQLTFMPRLFPVNCYIIEEEDSLTLVDAALPYSAKAILQLMQRTGKTIARIVLTHPHSDHVGALDAIKAALPDAPVYISRRDARLLDGDFTLDKEELHTPIRGGFPKAIKTRADILVQEGERIGSLLALAAPGHTPGSMAFLDTRNGALIAGDAFQTRGGIAVSGQLRPGFPFPAMATWNKERALESARHLLSYQPTLLAVGHGDLLHQPCAQMERAIAQAEHVLGRHS